jgi:SAM-dependent methyltransferase
MDHLCGIVWNLPQLWTTAVRQLSQAIGGYTVTLVATRDKLLSLIPAGGAGDYILDIAGQVGITALLHTRLGYGHVRGCAAGEAGLVEARAEDGVRWQVDHFDLERDFYPYPSAHFRTIVCVDVLEKLKHDPMYMLDEIHRVLRPGCDLVLGTRRYTAEQIRWLLENCGMQVAVMETDEEGCCAVGRKIGPLRVRYPEWLYPERR